MKKCTTATITGAFFRFPKELLTHSKYKHLSAETKILYGLLLDRLCLSLKNGWLDKNGDVYVYFSREEAMELFDCGPDKIARLFKELKEVDLVEKVQQGLHRPDKIYVGEVLPDTDMRAEEQPSNQQQPSDTTQTMSHLHPCPQISDVQRPQISDVQRPQISDVQRPQISDVQRPQISDASKTYYNKTDLSNTNLKRDRGNNHTHKDLLRDHQVPEGTRRVDITPRQHTYQPASAKLVCENATPLEQLKQLQKDIQTVIGEMIMLKRLEKLVQDSSMECIRYHLEHWHIHKQNQVRPGAGYFLTVVENDIPPVAPPQKPLYRNTGKVSIRENFEERQYSDEYLESFYANLEDVGEATTSQTQADPEEQSTTPAKERDTVGSKGESDSWNTFLETREKEEQYYEEVFLPMVLPSSVLAKRHAAQGAARVSDLSGQEDELTDAVDDLSEEAGKEPEYVHDDEDKYYANLAEEAGVPEELLPEDVEASLDIPAPALQNLLEDNHAEREIEAVAMGWAGTPFVRARHEATTPDDQESPVTQDQVEKSFTRESHPEPTEHMLAKDMPKLPGSLPLVPDVPMYQSWEAEFSSQCLRQEPPPQADEHTRLPVRNEEQQARMDSEQPLCEGTPNPDLVTRQNGVDSELMNREIACALQRLYEQHKPRSDVCTSVQTQQEESAACFRTRGSAKALLPGQVESDLPEENEDECKGYLKQNYVKADKTTLH